MDAAPATKGPNPNPAGDWTVVYRRRRGKQRQRDPLPDPTRPQIKTLALTPTASSPWTPIDSVIESARESKLLQRMQSAVRRLEGSRFYQRFLSRLRDAQIRNGLARVLGSGREFQMVVYGIGSIESYDPPRLQLALAVLLRRELGPAVASVDVFDPVLSATECAVVRALGCTVVPVDEQGRREATVPTLFYMPHCEAALYDALLEANWRPSMLNRTVVLGNSFAAYEKYVEEVAWSNGSVALEAASKHILGVRRYVREVEMEEKGEVEVEVEASGEVKEEEEDGFFKAFHDTSWHFFELDDDIQMNSLKK